MKRVFLPLIAAVGIALPPALGAATVSSLVGDKDGFGIGVLDGENFNYLSVGPTDVQGTDTWRFGVQSVSHVYSIPGGSISAANLELFTGGQGYPDGSISSVSLNGTFIGYLTDGDIGPGPNNFARKNHFDLMPFLSYLTGSDIVQISTNSNDGWVLDYSAITLTTRASVPEPATLVLLGLGLAGLAAARRRKQ